MPSNLPSSARSALREAAETLKDAVAEISRHAGGTRERTAARIKEGSARYCYERHLDDPEVVLSLLSLAEWGAEDTARIDWIDARLKTESPWMDFVIAADFQDGVWISRINRGDYRGAIAIDNSATPLAGVREAIDAASSPTGGTTE